MSVFIGVEESVSDINCSSNGLRTPLMLIRGCVQWIELRDE